MKSNLKNKAISGVVWKGLERVFAYLVTAIVEIVLARILVPEDYSVISIVTIFFTFCNVFISGGLNTALIQKKNSDSLDYSTILFANMIMAIILYAIMFFASPFIAQIYKKELLTPVIRIMALTFFINGYKAVVSAKIISDLEFRKFFWSTFIGTIISAFVGIAMAQNGYGAWALVAQQMTNSFIDATILTFSSKIRFIPKFSYERFKSLFGFGGKIMASAVISHVYDQTKPLIVGLKFSTLDLAYYNKGKTYPNLVAKIWNDTLSSSLFPAMAKVQDDQKALLQMVRRFIQLSSFVVFPLMIGFLASSEQFVRIVLTDKWLPIVPYLMLFCISDMLKPIQTGNLQAIRAIGRSDVFLKLEVIKKTSFFIIIGIFLFFTNSPILLAASGIITSLLASLINIFPNKKLIGYSYKMQFQDLYPNLICSIIMGITVYCMRFINININMYLLFALQIIVGIVSYVGISILLKNKNLSYLINTVKGFIKR